MLLEGAHVLFIDLRGNRAPHNRKIGGERAGEKARQQPVTVLQPSGPGCCWYCLWARHLHLSRSWTKGVPEAETGGEVVSTVRRNYTHCMPPYRASACRYLSPSHLSQRQAPRNAYLTSCSIALLPTTTIPLKPPDSC